MTSLEIGRRGVLAGLAGSTLAPGLARAASNGVTADTITLGAYLPLTGPIADVGSAALHGGMAYFNAVNARGGVHGRKLRWVTADDGYQPARALAAARRLIESDRVLGIFGTTGTGTALAVLPYLRQQKALLLFPYAAASQVLSPVIPTVFSILPTYAEQAGTLTEHLVKERQAKRIAFIYMNESENTLAAERGAAVLRRLGMDPVASVSFEKNTADFSSAVLQLQQAQPDYVVEAATTPDFARIIQQGLSRGFTPQWCGISTATDSIMIKLLGAAAEGVLGISPLKGAMDDDPAVAEYRRDLAASYPDDNPSAYNIFAYAGAKLLVAALEKTGPELTQDGLVATLNGMKDFDTGLTGPISFSPQDHLGTRSVVMLQVRGGKFVAVSKWFALNEQAPA